MENIKSVVQKQHKKYYQDEFIKIGNNYEGKYIEEYSPEIPAIIVNTSGTTGSGVKGAVHSNKSYNIYTNQIPLITKHLVRGNTFYGYIPYFSMYGTCVGMHTALTYGVVINNIPKYGGEKTLNDIINSKSNIMLGTPNMIERLADMYEERDADAHHVKQYVIGGDNVSSSKFKHENDVLLARGMQSKIIFGYGSTEALPISTTSFDERSHVEGSTGFLYPGVSVKVLNPETEEVLEHGEEGEIYVHTPNMMLGYLNNEEENKKVFKYIDGIKYFKTGDKGILTDKGILFINGRYKRLMKRPDCHQTSPIPIENVINDNPLVNECFVVGIKRKNGRPGVIPTAFIVLKNKPNSSYEEKQIIHDIAEDSLKKLSNEKEIALAYTVVDNLPYTINGKEDFRKLEELKFDNLKFYVLEDSIVNDYFEGFGNLDTIKINNNLTKTSHTPKGC